MKKFFTKMLTAAVLMTALMIACCAAADAESGYSIPAVNFSVDLQADGSVRVTENWTLCYLTDGYTRFLRELDSSENPVDFEIREDDILCIETSDTESRPDYRYAIESGSDMETLSLFLHADAGSVHIYTISYTLNNALVSDTEGKTLALPLIYGNSTVNPEEVSAAVSFDEDQKVAVNGITTGMINVTKGSIAYAISEPTARFGIYLTLCE